MRLLFINETVDNPMSMRVLSTSLGPYTYAARFTLEGDGMGETVSEGV